MELGVKSNPNPREQDRLSRIRINELQSLILEAIDSSDNSFTVEELHLAFLSLMKRNTEKIIFDQHRAHLG